MPRILFPGIRDWRELFTRTTRREDLDSSKASPYKPLEGSHTMQLSPFLRAQTLMTHEPLRHYDVELVAYLHRDMAAHLVEVTGDVLYFEAIEHWHHPDHCQGLTSIYIKHNKIIGSKLLACVLSKTVPWRLPQSQVPMEKVPELVQEGLPGFEEP